MTVDLYALAQIAIPLILSLLALAVTFGKIDTRLKATELAVQNAITRTEFVAVINSLEGRVNEVVQEVRTMRTEIINVIRDMGRHP